LRRVKLRDAGYGEDHRFRVELADGAFPLALCDVFDELLADGQGELVVVHDGEFVAFERGVKHEALEARVFAFAFDDRGDEGAEEAGIVVVFHELPCASANQAWRRSGAARVEDGLIEILLGGESGGR
jgi:hypothetical protein